MLSKAKPKYISYKSVHLRTISGQFRCCTHIPQLESPDSDSSKKINSAQKLIHDPCMEYLPAFTIHLSHM